MVLPFPQGMAAPLVGYPKLHVLDDFGMPLCMQPDRPPLNFVDMDRMRPHMLVLRADRCSRHGCFAAWDEMPTRASWQMSGQV
jgi:hypothetical protein